MTDRDRVVAELVPPQSGRSPLLDDAMPTEAVREGWLTPAVLAGSGPPKSFGDKRTAAIFAGYAIRDLPPHMQRRARAKLLAIDAAKRLDDLRVPPGNRLEALRGDREGQNSIRISEQWRICFVWRDGETWDVQIVDYH